MVEWWSGESLMLATLILAGGKSSRMGQDKALLVIQDLPLIRRIYDVAVQCCPPVYVISPWCDRYRPALPNSCQFIDEHIDKYIDRHIDRQINKQSQSQGPLLGFYQGFTAILDHVAVDWLLLVACDLPNLTSTIIQLWSTTLSDTPSSVIATLPPALVKTQNFPYGDATRTTFKTPSPISPLFHHSKQWHPLCGFYHRRCLPSLERFIETGGRSFQRWLANEEVRSLPIQNPDLLFNCNTPEDWERYCRHPSRQS